MILQRYDYFFLFSDENKNGEFSNKTLLQKTKVDEEFVKAQLKNKADKTAIENKVGREQFDICISEIDNNMQDMMQKLHVSLP